MKKLNMGKVALTLTMVSAISISSVFPALADWKQNDVGWWYEEENGSYIKNDWKLINDKWYYFGEDGYLYTNKITPDGYKVNENGEITEKISETKSEKDSSKSVSTSRSENFLIETTEEVTETPTTTIPETTTVAPTTEVPTTVVETTPKSTEYVSVGGWNNEEEAIKMGKNLQEQLGSSINPVKIYSSSSAGYGTSSANAIEVSKTGDGYQFNIYSKLSVGSNYSGLKALCTLVGDSSIASNIKNDYDNEVFTPGEWNSVGGHNYKVEVSNGVVTYYVQ